MSASGAPTHCSSLPPAARASTRLGASRSARFVALPSSLLRCGCGRASRAGCADSAAAPWLSRRRRRCARRWRSTCGCVRSRDSPRAFGARRRGRGRRHHHRRHRNCAERRAAARARYRAAKMGSRCGAGAARRPARGRAVDACGLLGAARSRRAWEGWARTARPRHAARLVTRQLRRRSAARGLERWRLAAVARPAEVALAASLQWPALLGSRVVCRAAMRTWSRRAALGRRAVLCRTEVLRPRWARWARAAAADRILRNGVLRSALWRLRLAAAASARASLRRATAARPFSGPCAAAAAASPPSRSAAGESQPCGGAAAGCATISARRGGARAAAGGGRPVGPPRAKRWR